MWHFNKTLSLKDFTGASDDFGLLLPLLKAHFEIFVLVKD